MLTPQTPAPEILPPGSAAPGAVPPGPTGGRALATVETVAGITPVPGADAIERARVRGWDVVVRAGELAAGDLCLYLEADSFLDVADPRFEFLAARGLRTRGDGVRGHVLTTGRLHGRYSQGLALPVGLFPEAEGLAPGTDVTRRLGVVAWEPPLPAALAGEVLGPRPPWIPVTGVARLQNVPEILGARDLGWIATEKIDGASSTFYVDGVQDTAGVCGRNGDLVESEENILWQMARGHWLLERIAQEWPGRRVALHGEVFGEGIRANPLRVLGRHLALFGVHVDGADLPRARWPRWVLELSVPVRDDLTFPESVEQSLAEADHLGSAIGICRPAEGVVWRAADAAARVRLPGGAERRAAFTVVSNGYLLRHDR
ncbi:RNA ligase (ATP) [Myceligenerans crystallogenes]|uniref:RNA ligase (ATP) n=1 Tax=Myceligenerans crystallogenes TaxID=316335 RepID=A0ABN2NHG1_9MICO